jgi:hypothetical protein
MKTKWVVRAAGKIFVMTGEACTLENALHCVRLIWPDATIDE